MLQKNKNWILQFYLCDCELVKLKRDERDEMMLCATTFFFRKPLKAYVTISHSSKS